tara:strand:+ start:203 stop:562 length:360 start_codon:yes stop_codon:yes gene_type:complete
MMELEVAKAGMNDADKCIMRLDKKTLIQLGIHPRTIAELVPNAQQGYDVIPQMETSGLVENHPECKREKNKPLYFVLMELYGVDADKSKVKIDEQDRDVLKVKEGSTIKLHRCEEWEIP